jgi:hypothetical protein
MTIRGIQTPQPSFGSAPQQYSQQWAAALLAQLARRLGLLAGPYTVQPQLLLQSPDGTVWQVTVSNAGAITAAVASPSQEERPPL